MKLPENLLYTKDHEWIHIDGEICKIGITDFAQGELGDIVYMEMPNIGDVVKSGDNAGTIEAVKTVADIYSPVDGVVCKINDKLIENPEFINSSPYGDGWIIMLEIKGLVDKNSFLNSTEYEDFIR